MGGMKTAKIKTQITNDSTEFNKNKKKTHTKRALAPWVD